MRNVSSFALVLGMEIVLCAYVCLRVRLCVAICQLSNNFARMSFESGKVKLKHKHTHSAFCECLNRHFFLNMAKLLQVSGVFLKKKFQQIFRFFW